MMYFRTTAITALSFALLAPTAFAQSTPPELQPIAEPPPLPGHIESGEILQTDDDLESDVVISRRDKSTVTEYRVNGRLRAIKVQPDGDFPPYYLYDTDGDGRLDQRRNRYDPKLLIPNWVIFSW